MMTRDLFAGPRLGTDLAPFPVLAADAGGEIVTAATHADLASKADLPRADAPASHAQLPGRSAVSVSIRFEPCANRRRRDLTR